MEVPHNHKRPSRILLITHSRTASHLLAKMLSKQPDCIYQSHAFAIRPRELHRTLRKLEVQGKSNPTMNAELLSNFKQSNQDFVNFPSKAEEAGKIPFLHNQPHTIIAPKRSVEYAGGSKFTPEDHDFWFVGEPGQEHTNFTILPDEVFLYPGASPVISFRHPVLVVDGIYRGLHDPSAHPGEWEGIKLHLRTSATLRWMRMMYDWYIERGASSHVIPVLVEADDYMGPYKETVMRDLCEQAGLDASSVIYSWPKVTDEEVKALPPIMAHAFRTINSSQGVLPGYSLSERDLGAEMKEWNGKYGNEAASLMHELVDDMMPDYEYLRARRTVGVRAR